MSTPGLSFENLRKINLTSEKIRILSRAKLILPTRELFRLFDRNIEDRIKCFISVFGLIFNFFVEEPVNIKSLKDVCSQIETFKNLENISDLQVNLERGSSSHFFRILNEFLDYILENNLDNNKSQYFNLKVEEIGAIDFLSSPKEVHDISTHFRLGKNLPNKASKDWKIILEKDKDLIDEIEAEYKEKDSKLVMHVELEKASKKLDKIFPIATIDCFVASIEEALNKIRIFEESINQNLKEEIKTYLNLKKNFVIEREKTDEISKSNSQKRIELEKLKEFIKKLDNKTNKKKNIKIRDNSISCKTEFKNLIEETEIMEIENGLLKNIFFRSCRSTINLSSSNQSVITS